MRHVSASQIDTFLRCGMQWYFRYIERIKSPPSVAMAQGTSLHAGAEHNYAYKVETFEDLPVDEILDVTRDAFLTEADRVEDWEKLKPSAALDQTIDITRAYQCELAPTIQPTAVETEILLERPEWKYPLLGYIDIETADRIIDIKTAARKKTQADLETSMQAGIYMLARKERGLPEAFDWHVAVKTKTPAVQVLSRERIDHEHTVAFVSRVQDAIDVAIASGVFAPALPGTWWCSERFCGYHNICPFGGKK